MKKILLVVLCGLFTLASSGCQSSQTKTGEGAFIGGIIGAAAGGIIGHQSRHGEEGAALGAAAGVLTGAVVGSQIKKPQAAQTNQAYNSNLMSIQQIVSLSQQGASEAVIIDRIRLSNSQFRLTASDMEYLKQQGVSQKVIDAMQGL